MDGKRKITQLRIVHQRVSGQSIPLIALMILVLVAIVGLAVDVGNTYAEHRRAVSASNAAAVAAMDVYIEQGSSTTNADVYTAITESLDSNGIDIDSGERTFIGTYLAADGKPVEGRSPIIDESGQYVPVDTTYIKVEIDGTEETFFARMVGQDTLPISVEAYAGQCPPTSSVYPLTINGEVIDASGTMFVDPGEPLPGQPEIWGDDAGGVYRNLSWRRLYLDDEASTSEFGWTRWSENTDPEGNPATSLDALRASLSGDGNVALGFTEIPTWPPDTGQPEPDIYPTKPQQMNEGDWLFGTDASVIDVETLLNAHKVDGGRGTVMFLPIYNAARGSDTDAIYRTSKLGAFVIRDFGIEVIDTLEREYVELIFLGTDLKNSTACTTTAVAPQVFGLEGGVQIWPEYQLIPEDRKPIQYVVVLDGSGSMNMNFAGLGSKGSRDRQCTNGGPGVVNYNCGQPDWAWRNEDERRIYVAKQALIRLIELSNFTGSADYDATRPLDEMSVVWFKDKVMNNMVSNWSSDKDYLVDAVLDAGAYRGDSYKTQGGTNGGAGLYKAAQLFDARQPYTMFQGQRVDYKRVTLFVTDGVSNNFVDITDTRDLSAGFSGNSTYPRGHYCRSLSKIAESVECMTNEVGGTYRKGRKILDRPITGMINVSNDYLKANDIEVFALALSYLPDTGLRTGVASFPSYYYEAPTLIEYPDGTTNVDQIVTEISTKVETGLCIPKADNAWLETFTPESVTNLPDLSYPGVGEVFLYQGDQLIAKTYIEHDAEDGSLSYAFTNIPRGTYRLISYMYYRHPLDPPTMARQYGMIDRGGTETVTDITIDIPSGSQSLGGVMQLPLQLKLNGQPCPETE